MDATKAGKTKVATQARGGHAPGALPALPLAFLPRRRRRLAEQIAGGFVGAFAEEARPLVPCCLGPEVAQCTCADSGQ